MLDEHAIRNSAECCSNEFTKLLDGARDDAIVLARIPQLLEQPPDTKPILTIEDLRDEFQQFQLWVRNLGVFAPNHSSLDFRLREAKDVKEGILSLLRSLCTDLSDSRSSLMA